MTLIRIDPAEMESASNELQNQAAIVGETLTGLRAQCASHCLPPAVASQVDATLATLEPALRDIQVELVLEGTILAMRGIMAIKGSAFAGELEMPLVAAPGVGLLTGGSVAAAGTFSGTGGSGSIGGFATSGGAGSAGGYQVPVGELDFGDIPDSTSSPVGSSYRRHVQHGDRQLPLAEDLDRGPDGPGQYSVRSPGGPHQGGPRSRKT